MTVAPPNDGTLASRGELSFSNPACSGTVAANAKCPRTVVAVGGVAQQEGTL